MRAGICVWPGSGTSNFIDVQVALAIVRNLCVLSGFRQIAAKDVGHILIAVCWAVEDDTCKQHALGALANLAANQRPSEILIEFQVLFPFSSCLSPSSSLSLRVCVQIVTIAKLRGNGRTRHHCKQLRR